MKIVQSFWSKPQLKNSSNTPDNRFAGGWLQKKYYYMGIAMSCLQLRKFYDEVELVTDEFGKNLIIDQLGLPYTNTMVTLDVLNNHNANLWALGKLYTYSLQDKPFLHVDTDVFIWKAFSDELLNSPLIAQHLEYQYPFYQSLLKQLDNNHIKMPAAIAALRSMDTKVSAYNMGIAGGRDLDFFKEYTSLAFEFLKTGPRVPDNLIGPFNTIYEQVLFYCLALQHQKTITPFSKTIGEQVVDDELKGINNFIKAPNGVSYIHLYGESKRTLPFCIELEKKFSSSYPLYHDRILSLLESEVESAIPVSVS
jgi:hypothetical protein